MNKKLKDFFQGKGFEINKNHGYGNLYGYEVNVNIQMLNNIIPVVLDISFFASDDVKQKIALEITNLKIKRLMIQQTGNGISIGLNDITVGKLVKRFDSILEMVFNVIKSNEALGADYCPICGTELDINTPKYTINAIKIRLDEKCVNDINAQIEIENSNIKAAPNNYLRGFGGALLGALVGVVSFIILFFMGYISALSAVVAIALGGFLYKKLDGKPNFMMVVIVTVTSLFSLLIVLLVLYIIVAQSIAIEYGFTSTGFKAFIDCMKVPEFSSEFGYNLFLTFIFSLLGGAVQGYSLYKTTIRTKKITK